MFGRERWIKFALASRQRQYAGRALHFMACFRRTLIRSLIR
jgi:hypothetical protein